MECKNLVVIPFAYLESAKTGANLKSKDDPISIYTYNALVSAVSCKRNNPGVDVAFVTNYDIGEYKHRFESNDIMVMYCPFESFRFPNNYQWCLAFYKLCVLKFVTTLQYENVLCIDADTYIQMNFDYLWGNLSQNIVVYDLGGSTVEPLGELAKLNYVRCMYNNRIQKVGGEFIAGNCEILKSFIIKAEEIFNTMKQNEIKVASGDEYITSLTAACFHNIDYSGVRYIYRFWTGHYRDVCNRGQIGVTPILHVPGSKKDGMRKLYKYFIKNNDFPRREKIYKWFHFNHRDLKHFVLAIYKGTLFHS